MRDNIFYVQSVGFPIPEARQGTIFVCNNKGFELKLAPFVSLHFVASVGVGVLYFCLSPLCFLSLDVYCLYCLSLLFASHCLVQCHCRNGAVA